MRNVLTALMFLTSLSATAWAQIPATPVLTYYQFGGGSDIPYYRIDRGGMEPAGSLALGSSIIPCLVIRDGRPLTDAGGNLLVGFQVVVDARNATPASNELFEAAVAERRALSVPNHQCDANVKYAISVRDFFPLGKPPFFDPPFEGRMGKVGKGSGGRPSLDEIVRAFHNSGQCAEAGRTLMGRRAALEEAWERFIAEHRRVWPEEFLQRARNLDYTMRTAIYEGHLDRGCNAYGACERNIIALSIRNRGKACSRGQGCSFPGDYQGVATKVSQYNIWDESLTQISGLTSCFLRDDISGEGPETIGGKAFNRAYYRKIRGMYEQGVAEVEQILYGGDDVLEKIFPGTPLGDLASLRHYYHAPAMGKCFPQHPRVEYVTAATARKGDDFALIVNTRIQVDDAAEGGYRFRQFVLKPERDRDVIEMVDAYPGFVVDGRKIDLKGSSGCVPYGVPHGCSFKEVGRWRRTPSWVHAGRPVEIHCRSRDRGEQCTGPEAVKPVDVGGRCDTEMRPFSGIR